MLKVKVQGALDAHINTQNCKDWTQVIKRLGDELKFSDDKIKEYAL